MEQNESHGSVILIGIGSNLPGRFGSSARLVEAAIAALDAAPLRRRSRSRLWRTRPVPDNGEPWFVNAVVAVETCLEPDGLLAHLLAIEQRFERQRTKLNAPRTLDLDLLDYHGRISNPGAEAVIPHARMAGRAFVLRPMAEIAPAWRHPVSGESLDEMLAHLPDDQFAEPIMAEIMGIVNVTPDSFSDGGAYLQADAAVAHGLKLLRDGAHILDIGGESTRPGARPVPVADEIARVVPAIAALAEKARAMGGAVSVDTRNAATMQAALQAGAGMVNDVSALTHDPRSVDVLAASDCRVVLMHMQGTPETMQVDPTYKDVVGEVYAWLEQRIAFALTAGVARERLIVDPGIGFGKTLAHNLALLRGLGRFRDLGVAVMAGVSRKQFIGRLSHGETPDHRLGGSIAAALFAAFSEADIVRVHDVAETAQALKVWHALTLGRQGPCAS